jgi:hypothetical protein
MRIFLVVLVFAITGCIDCDTLTTYICGRDDPPIDSDEQDTSTVATPVYGCENLGPGGACFCHDCVDHQCFAENCEYYDDAVDQGFICDVDDHCRLLCNPEVDPDGCKFTECVGDLLDCSHYGYACNEVCPNT